MIGIIFDGESIRGIKDGTKIMTRRVAKKVPWMNPSIHRVVYDRHPFSPSAFVGTPAEGKIKGKDRFCWSGEDAYGQGIGVEELSWLKCPYGLPGDIVRVKERWATSDNMVGYGFPFWYEEDNSILCVGSIGIDGLNIVRGKWRTPLYMPECATRIWLKIEEVRLEPLQYITQEDAAKEGIVLPVTGIPVCDPITWFHVRWDEINKKRGFGWDTNPMVWVITFSVHKILETRKG